MSEEQIVRHIHETKDNRPDSIDFASSVKEGPGLKIYFNAAAPQEETERLISSAFAARSFAIRKHAEKEAAP